MSGNTEWAAEYGSLELGQGQALIIAGCLPCMKLMWLVPERRDGLS